MLIKRISLKKIKTKKNITTNFIQFLKTIKHYNNNILTISRTIPPKLFIFKNKEIITRYLINYFNKKNAKLLIQS